MNVLEAREVGTDEPRSRSVLRYRLDDLLPALLVASGDHDVGSGSRVGAGDCLADPRCATGYQHFLVLNGHAAS